MGKAYQLNVLIFYLCFAKRLLCTVQTQYIYCLCTCTEVDLNEPSVHPSSFVKTFQSLRPEIKPFHFQHTIC